MRRRSHRSRPSHELASDSLVGAVLGTLGWSRAELDPFIPPRERTPEHRIWSLLPAAPVDWPICIMTFAALKRIKLDDSLTTIRLIWREGPAVFHARNPFPVGGVVEDPATGAAAAARGGYLRDARLVEAPVTIEISQGETMGRPSRLRVEIPRTGGIVVAGTAVRLALAESGQSSLGVETEPDRGI